MSVSVVKKRRREGAGFSVPVAAEEIGVTYKTLREAIAMNSGRAVIFGRLTRVPNSEVARLKEDFPPKLKRPRRTRASCVCRLADNPNAPCRSRKDAHYVCSYAIRVKFRPSSGRTHPPKRQLAS